MSLKKAGINVPRNKEVSIFIKNREFYGTCRDQALVILTAEV